MTLFVFLISLGAALRLTRLAVEDTIFAPVRAWLANRYSKALVEHANRVQDARDLQPTELALEQPELDRLQRRAGIWLWFVQLLECPWCIGFWISLGAAGAALSPLGTSHGAVHTWGFVFPALALSISYLVGVIHTLVFTVQEFEPGNHS